MIGLRYTTDGMTKQATNCSAVDDVYVPAQSVFVISGNGAFGSQGLSQLSQGSGNVIEEKADDAIDATTREVKP